MNYYEPFEDSEDFNLGRSRAGLEAGLTFDEIEDIDDWDPNDGDDMVANDPADCRYSGLSEDDFEHFTSEDDNPDLVYEDSGIDDHTDGINLLGDIWTSGDEGDETSGEDDDQASDAPASEALAAILLRDHYDPSTNQIRITAIGEVALRMPGIYRLHQNSLTQTGSFHERRKRNASRVSCHECLVVSALILRIINTMLKGRLERFALGIALLRLFGTPFPEAQQRTDNSLLVADAEDRIRRIVGPNTFLSSQRELRGLNGATTQRPFRTACSKKLAAPLERAIAGGEFPILDDAATTLAVLQTVMGVIISQVQIPDGAVDPMGRWFPVRVAVDRLRRDFGWLEDRFDDPFVLEIGNRIEHIVTADPKAAAMWSKHVEAHSAHLSRRLVGAGCGSDDMSLHDEILDLLVNSARSGEGGPDRQADLVGTISLRVTPRIARRTSIESLGTRELAREIRAAVKLELTHELGTDVMGPNSTVPSTETDRLITSTADAVSVDLTLRLIDDAVYEQLRERPDVSRNDVEEILQSEYQVFPYLLRDDRNKPLVDTARRSMLAVHVDELLRRLARTTDNPRRI